METNRGEIARRVVEQVSHSFEVYLHCLSFVNFLFCFFFVIIFPSMVFGKDPFYYTANEGGSISKVDALSNNTNKRPLN